MTNKNNTNRKYDDSKKSSKKGNNIIGILFIILVIFIIIGFFSISMVKTGDTSGYFNKEDKSIAQSIYDKIIAITEENYPKTPEEVVSIYTESYSYYMEIR